MWVTLAVVSTYVETCSLILKGSTLARQSLSLFLCSVPSSFQALFLRLNEINPQPFSSALGQDGQFRNERNFSYGCNATMEVWRRESSEAPILVVFSPTRRGTIGGVTGLGCRAACTSSAPARAEGELSVSLRRERGA